MEGFRTIDHVAAYSTLINNVDALHWPATRAVSSTLVYQH